MAYEKLKQQLLEQRGAARAPVDTPLRGTGRLPPGRHTVRLTGVDTLWLDSRGYIELMLSLGVNQWQRHRVWFLDRSRQYLSKQLSELATALFAKDAVVWYDWLDLDRDNALQFLRGLQLGVQVSQGPGYVVDVDHGTYLLLDGETRKVYGTGYATVSDATTAAEAKKLDRSKLMIKEVYDVASERNNAALRMAT